MYSVATRFNQQTWDRFGLNWLRKAKSEKLKGFVFVHNLSDDALAKISSLGFESISHEVPLFERCGERCLLTTPDLYPRGGMTEEYDVVCSIDKGLPIMDLVWSVANLHNRAKAAQLLQRKIQDRYGGFFSAKYVLGSKKFWTDFTEFGNYLRSQSTYFHGNIFDEFVLNLYLTFFNIRIGIEND